MILRGKILENSYLIFIIPETYLLPNSDTQYIWGNEVLFLGRSVGHPGDNQVLIKNWLDLYRNSHHSPCNIENIDLSEKFDSMIQESYFGVIDIVDLQFTMLLRQDVDIWKITYTNTFPSSSRSSRTGTFKKEILFVVLFYIWRKEDPYKTILKNIVFHRNYSGFE